MLKPSGTINASTVLEPALILAVEDEMPEMGLSAVKTAEAVKLVRGIQYSGKYRSQTRRAEVVSKMSWPERMPRMRFSLGRIRGR